MIDVPWYRQSPSFPRPEQQTPQDLREGLTGKASAAPDVSSLTRPGEGLIPEESGTDPDLDLQEGGRGQKEKRPLVKAGQRKPN